MHNVFLLIKVSDARYFEFFFHWITKIPKNIQLSEMLITYIKPTIRKVCCEERRLLTDEAIVMLSTGKARMRCSAQNCADNYKSIKSMLLSFVCRVKREKSDKLVCLQEVFKNSCSLGKYFWDCRFSRINIQIA